MKLPTLLQINDIVYHTFAPTKIIAGPVNYIKISDKEITYYFTFNDGKGFSSSTNLIIDGKEFYQNAFNSEELARKACSDWGREKFNINIER